MGTFTIRGWITLGSTQWFDDAVAIVGLNDVSRIDSPSVRVVETIIAPIRGLQQRIAFCLMCEEATLTGDSFVLSAEIRRSDKTRLERGDFLTTAAFPWHRGDRDAPLLEVHQI
jgi:uncharacterized lipoprotein YbaY